MKQRTRKLLTLLLIAAMVMSLAVPAFADNTAYSETPYTYDAGDYTFGKISHADKATGTISVPQCRQHRKRIDIPLLLHR